MSNMPIRVLAIVCCLVPGGLEKRLMDIIRNIDRKRVIIDVFTYRIEEGVYDAEVRNLGGKVYYNPPLNVSNMFWYVKYFKDFLEHHPEYRIIHAHQDAWCGVFCKGAYLAKVPVRIAHSRTALAGINIQHLAKDLIKLSTRRYANYYFAVSKNAAIWLFGIQRYKNGEITILPNSIDTDSFIFDESTRIRVRKENNWDNKFIVIHVGNITPPKNHEFIIKVFSAVAQYNKDAVLVLVGGGEQYRLRKIIEDLSLEEQIEFLGLRNDVGELLQASDVFLFPSKFEGLPGALIEAQASGIPCVVSDRIPDEAIISPNVQVLSLNEDIEKWSQAVLEQKHYCRKLGKQSIEKNKYDIESLVKWLMSFYEEVYR